MSARAHFRIFGIPIRIEPIFWIVTVLFGLQFDEIRFVLSWVFVVLLSLLVHELGHGLALKAFGLPSSIVLHAFGGFTTSTRRPDTTARRVLVSLAGSLTAMAVLWLPLRGLVFSDWWFDQTPIVRFIVYYLAWVNLWWSLANLLPIRPLDGGNVATELFGLKTARWLSVVIGAGAALYCFFAPPRGTDLDFAGFFALMLAGLNFVEIRNEQRGAAQNMFDVDAPDTGGATTKTRRRSRRSHLTAVPSDLPPLGGSANRDSAETRAWTALRDGRTDVALSALEPFARDSGLDPFLRASLALASGRGEMADELFERAYRANPDGPPNLFVAGLLANEGRAVSVAHRLVGQDGVGTDAAGSLQTHLHYGGHFREAAEVGELVFSAGPASPAQTAFETACSWAKAGNAGESIRWVETAIEAGFTAGTLLDAEPDLEVARAEPAWAAVRARAN